MNARSVLTLWLMMMIVGITGICPVMAAGPLDGRWRIDVSTIVGGPKPWEPPGNVFLFTEASGGNMSTIQAQNSPQTGAALCSMVGTRSGNILSGTEVCGIPRNSFGAFRGIIDNTFFATRLWMIWADSKGVYYVYGTRLLP